MIKKAQIAAFLPYIFLGAVIALIFALVAVPVAYMSDEIMDELKEDDNFGSSNLTVDRINQVQALTTTAFDQLIFIILIAFVLGSLVLAIFTDFHPVVIVILILAIVMLIIVTGLMANAYDEVANTDILKAKADEFTLTNAIMGEQLPVIIGIVGVIAIIIILAKRGGVTAPV